MAGVSRAVSIPSGRFPGFAPLELDNSYSLWYNIAGGTEWPATCYTSKVREIMEATKTNLDEMFTCTDCQVEQPAWTKVPTPQGMCGVGWYYTSYYFPESKICSECMGKREAK